MGLQEVVWVDDTGPVVGTRTLTFLAQRFLVDLRTKPVAAPSALLGERRRDRLFGRYGMGYSEHGRSCSKNAEKLEATGYRAGAPSMPKTDWRSQ